MKYVPIAMVCMTLSVVLPTLVFAQSAAPCLQLSGTLGPSATDRSTNGDVSALQHFLAQDPSVYPEGIISGYYGNLTIQAVQRFQEKNGIASSGDPRSTGYGAVGPATKAFLASGCASAASFGVTVASAPQTLTPGQTGTWTLRTTGGTAPISFLAGWGDGQPSVLQSGTAFTHAYTGAGTYYPIFAARDASNRAANAQAPAVVVSKAAGPTDQTNGQGSSGAVTIGTAVDVANGTSNSGQAPTCTMTISPTKLSTPGASATLSWSSAHATSGAIPEIGPIAVPNGSITVNPMGTTTYAATFIGAGGSVACTATVGVPTTPPPQVAVPNGFICGLRDLKCETRGLGMIPIYGDETDGYYAEFHWELGAYYPITTRSHDNITFHTSPSWGVNVPCNGAEITVKACGTRYNSNKVVSDDIICPSGYTGVLMSSYISDVSTNPTSQSVNGDQSISVVGGVTPTYKYVVTCAKGYVVPKPDLCTGSEISNPSGSCASRS